MYPNDLEGFADFFGTSSETPAASGNEPAPEPVKTSEAPDGGAPAQAEPVADATPAAVTPPTPAAQPEPAPPQVQPVPNVTALESKIEALVDVMGKQIKPETPAAPQPRAPRYAFDIPQPLQQALASEDPAERVKGMTMLGNGVAEAVHDSVMQEAVAFVSRAVPAMLQQMMQRQSASEQITSDFYGKYPDLRNPQLAPLVQQVTAEEAKGAKGWTPELRDKIGQRVMAIIGKTPAPAPAPAPIPPAAKLGAGSGARNGSPVPQLTDFQKEFASIK